MNPCSCASSSLHFTPFHFIELQSQGNTAQGRVTIYSEPRLWPKVPTLHYKPTLFDNLQPAITTLSESESFANITHLNPWTLVTLLLQCSGSLIAAFGQLLRYLWPYSSSSPTTPSTQRNIFMTRKTDDFSVTFKSFERMGAARRLRCGDM